MYSTIMLPVDLQHREKLTRATAVAADLAKHYGASLTMVGVTGGPPSAIGHTPAEYAAALSAFAGECGTEHDIAIRAHTALSQDPAAELAEALAGAVSELEADLIVMASHVPSFADHLFGSNAGRLAAETDRSIMIVR